MWTFVYQSYWAMFFSLKYNNSRHLPWYSTEYVASQLEEFYSQIFFQHLIGEQTFENFWMKNFSIVKLEKVGQ